MAKIPRKKEFGQTYMVNFADASMPKVHCIFMDEYTDGKEGRTVVVWRVFTCEGIQHYDEEEAQLFPTPQNEDECWRDVFISVLEQAHKEWNALSRRCSELETERDKYRKQSDDLSDRMSTMERSYKDQLKEKDIEIQHKVSEIEDHTECLIELRKAFSCMTGNPYPDRHDHKI